MSAITLSGFNGIDFNSILDAVMQAESQPLNALQDEQTKVQNKDSAFVSLAGIISALQAPVTSLTTVTGFSNVSATSSAESIATISMGDDGSVGQYEVSISHLAKAQVTKSTSGFSAVTDVAATGGSISFTINGSTTTAINITSNTTLNELKQKINDQHSGVIASIVNDGTNYKLVITGHETGEDNAFTINNTLTNSGGSAVTFAGNAQQAQNALFNVNGIDIETASNTVSDAIPGGTITLLKAGDTTVNVKNDYTSIKDSLKAVVAQYNKLRQFNSQQTQGGALSGDPILREILSDARKILVTADANGGRYSYLSEIGIELTSSGDLKLDETKLDAALSSYPDDVQKLLQGANGSTGVFGALKSTLNNLDGTSGLIKSSRDSIRTTLGRYSGRIERQQNMLDIRRLELQKQYAAADQAMSRLSALTSSISNLQRTI